MVDVASMILGEFQDSLVGVFGSSFGWLIGHLIVLSVLTLVILSIRNRDHIISESGYGSRNFAQALAVVGMTASTWFTPETWDFLPPRPLSWDSLVRYPLSG